MTRDEGERKTSWRNAWGTPRALTAPSPCLVTLQALGTCRTAQIVTQYCVGANYTWLLVEGIYLHSLLVLVGGSEGGPFRGYLLFGWGEPRPCPLPSLAHHRSPTPLLGCFRGLSPGFAFPPQRGNSAGLGPGEARARADSCGGVGGGGRGLHRGPRAFRHSLGDRQVPVREHAVSCGGPGRGLGRWAGL